MSADVGYDLHPATAVPSGLSPLLWSSLQSMVAAHSVDGSMRILDCGGGSGSLSVPLAALGADVTVVDVSIDALATLRRRATEAGVSDRITAVQGEVESLGELVPAAHFDIVLAHEVLEVLSSVALGLSQVCGALAPTGVASIVTGNPVAVVLGRALVGDLDGALEFLARTTDSTLQPDALVGECARAGLAVQSIEGLSVFSDIVPGLELERPGAMTALAELESSTSTVSPFREIATKLHITARRADTSD